MLRDDYEMMTKIKTYLLLFILGILTVFILQNISTVEIRFLFWHLSVSRTVILLTLVSTGIIIGWLLHIYYLAHIKNRAKKI